MKELAALLGVSRSTVSLWVRDIVTEEQRTFLRKRMGGQVQQREIERFWLGLLDLPRDCLRKTAVNRFSKHSQKKRVNKLRYGTCRITVADTQLVHNIYGAIQEYGGFEREEWVM